MIFKKSHKKSQKKNEIKFNLNEIKKKHLKVKK